MSRTWISDRDNVVAGELSALAAADASVLEFDAQVQPFLDRVASGDSLLPDSRFMVLMSSLLGVLLRPFLIPSHRTLRISLVPVTRYLINAFSALVQAAIRRSLLWRECIKRLYDSASLARLFSAQRIGRSLRFHLVDGFGVGMRLAVGAVPQDLHPLRVGLYPFLMGRILWCILKSHLRAPHWRTVLAVVAFPRYAAFSILHGKVA